MLEGTKLYSIFTMTCPKCQKGKLFKYNPYKLKYVFDMYKNCKNCNQKFELESGFYYGAMYVSYAICSAYLIIIWVIYYLLANNYSKEIYLLFSILSLILFMPYFFRLSRIIWINIFVNYDKDKQKLKNDNKNIR